ncbi:MAG: hypothetical protein C4B58_00330 [Deltaproteobacteria bacterium]|nr:MAG: hypothetical protein C4B58_00330 [Deltaproteobacteria bacterium]
MAKIQVCWVVVLNIASYFLAKLIEKIITESPRLEQIFSQYVDINFYYMIFVTILNVGILYFITRKNRRVFNKIIDQQKESITEQEKTINLLKNQLSTATQKNDEVDVLEFPNVIWLTVKDIEKDYNIGLNKLKQHIENGLPGHIKILGTDKTRPLDKDRDLVALEEWPDQAEELIEQWLFKTKDIERYIKAHNQANSADS